jgi:hypothetical protein
MTAELAAARQRVEDERLHSETRLADQRAGYEERHGELRAELEALRSGAPLRGTESADR